MESFLKFFLLWLAVALLGYFPITVVATAIFGGKGSDKQESFVFLAISFLITCFYYFFF